MASDDNARQRRVPLRMTMHALGEELLPRPTTSPDFESGRQPRNLVAAVVIVTTLVVWAGFGVSSLFIWHSFTVDDAFIGWRHGLNFVEHGSFAFNPPPADPVDAATSPLYGWLGAVPPLGGIDVVLFFKLVSLVIAAGYLLVAARLTTDMTNRLLFVLLGLAGPIQAIHLWSGLETSCYILLSAVLGAYALGRLRVSMWTAGLLSVLLVLAREEGAFMICAAVWIRYVLPALPDLRAAVKEFLRAAPLWAPSLLSVISLIIWRVARFGSALPNTFTTKMSGGWATSHLITNGYHFLPLAVVAGVVGWLAREERSHYLWLVGWAAVPGLLLYLPANLVMNYADRFPYQMLWPVVLAGISLAQGPGMRRLLIGAICSVLPLAFIPPALFQNVVDYHPRGSQALGVLGEALHDSGTGGTLVIGDAGLAPYVSGWLVLDTNFLGTDARMGPRGIADQIRQPGRTVLALNSVGPLPNDVQAAQDQYKRVAESSGYRLLGALKYRSHHGWLIYVSPDAGADQRLTSCLRRAIDISIRKNSGNLLRDSLFHWWWHSVPVRPEFCCTRHGSVFAR